MDRKRVLEVADERVNAARHHRDGARCELAIADHVYVQLLGLRDDLEALDDLPDDEQLGTPG